MSGLDYAAALEAHSHAMEVLASIRDAVTDYHRKNGGLVKQSDPELALLQTKLREAEEALDVARSNVQSFR